MKIYTIADKVEKGVAVGYHEVGQGRKHIPALRVGRNRPEGNRDLIAVHLTQVNHRQWKQHVDRAVQAGHYHRGKYGRGGNLRFGEVPVRMHDAYVGETRGKKPCLYEMEVSSPSVVVVVKNGRIGGEIERWSCQNREWGEYGCDGGRGKSWPGFRHIPRKCPCCGEILAKHLRVAFKQFQVEVLVAGLQDCRDPAHMDFVGVVEDGTKFHVIKEDTVLVCRVEDGVLKSEEAMFMRQSVCTEGFYP